MKDNWGVWQKSIATFDRQLAIAKRNTNYSYGVNIVVFAILLLFGAWTWSRYDKYKDAEEMAANALELENRVKAEYGISNPGLFKWEDDFINFYKEKYQNSVIWKNYTEAHPFPKSEK